MYTDKNVKLINYLIALIPLSLILGNLIVNINIILICVVGIIICGKETLKIKKNYPEKNAYTAETGYWKRHFLKGTRITRP